MAKINDSLVDRSQARKSRSNYAIQIETGQRRTRVGLPTLRVHWSCNNLFAFNCVDTFYGECIYRLFFISSDAIASDELPVHQFYYNFTISLKNSKFFFFTMIPPTVQVHAEISSSNINFDFSEPPFIFQRHSSHTSHLFTSTMQFALINFMPFSTHSRINNETATYVSFIGAARAPNEILKKLLSISRGLSQSGLTHSASSLCLLTPSSAYESRKNKIAALNALLHSQLLFLSFSPSPRRLPLLFHARAAALRRFYTIIFFFLHENYNKNLFYKLFSCIRERAEESIEILLCVYDRVRVR